MMIMWLGDVEKPTEDTMSGNKDKGEKENE
jgi:hypothetical protein